MKQLQDFLKELVFTPTVSGYEKMSCEKIMKMCLDFTDNFFTESRITKTGSIVLCRKCGKDNAKKLCFDAHLDTIGFAVTKVCSTGYLHVTNLGGIDINILPSNEVLVLGKEILPGVISSVPPHLAGGDKLPDIGELQIDTGLSQDKLAQLCDIGTPVTFKPHFTPMLNDRVCATGLDDKVCIALAMQAVKNMDKKQLCNTDIYVYLSSGEERGGVGSHHIYEEIAPDALIVLDVNFAKEKGSIDGEYGILGQGPMVSISSVTNIKFTRFVIDSGENQNLQIVNEMTYTGTNADVAAKTGLGLVSAVVSIPIKYMHSTIEMCDMKDVACGAKVLASTAHRYNGSSIGIPVYYKGGADNE